MQTSLRRERSLSLSLVFAIAAAVTLHAQLAADTFGSGATQFHLDFVPVGNPGNAADIHEGLPEPGYPNPAGSVAYWYRMGTYEVSRDMITKANNAGGLGITMNDMTRFGGNGPGRPATGVSWLEAARLVNWLNQVTGHQPAYNLSGASLSLWPSGDAWQAGGENLFRHKDAYYFLPSEQEWYKAAYYDGTLGVYYDYPTGSDSAPAAVAGGTGAGSAVYDLEYFGHGPADIANAGGLSAYGTMGQGGNVWEWMESAADLVNDSASESRALRGGGWGDQEGALWSWVPTPMRAYGPPGAEADHIGFRVAAVPEPTVRELGIAALGFALRRRRGRIDRRPGPGATSTTLAGQQRLTTPDP